MDGEKAGAVGMDGQPPPYTSPQHQANAAAGEDNAGWTASGWSQDPPAYATEYKTPNESYPPYPTQYMEHQQQNVVIVHPHAMPMGPLQDPPEDYMCYSIFVTLCCCWLIGILAILRSSECRAAIAAGDRVTAGVRSREARTRAHLALVLGIASIIFTFVFVGVYIGIVLNSY